jgi:hypothetical protein
MFNDLMRESRYCKTLKDFQYIKDLCKRFNTPFVEYKLFDCAWSWDSENNRYVDPVYTPNTERREWFFFDVGFQGGDDFEQTCGSERPHLLRQVKRLYRHSNGKHRNTIFKAQGVLTHDAI